MKIIIKLISVFTCMLLASCHSITSQSTTQAPEVSSVSTPCKPYTLTVELWNTGTNERIIQTIDINEKESFRMSTVIDQTTWTISGVPGKVEDNHIPIELTTLWFSDENNNQTSRMPLKLKINEDEMMPTGCLRGVFVKASVVTNQAANQPLEPTR